MDGDTVSEITNIDIQWAFEQFMLTWRGCLECWEVDKGGLSLAELEAGNSRRQEEGSNSFL